MKHYYAQSTPYGATTASIADTLYRFNSKEDRDAWVSEAFKNCYYLDAKRMQLTAKEARRYYPDAFKKLDTWCYWLNDTWEFFDRGIDEWSGHPTGGEYRYIGA